VSRILEDTYTETQNLIDEHWVAVEAVAKALLQRETLDGKLIHRAVAMASEGSAVDEIVEWIVDASVEAERKLQEAGERERRAAEDERRRKATDAGRGLQPLEPRSEPRPAPEPGARRSAGGQGRSLGGPSAPGRQARRGRTAVASQNR